MNAPLDHICVCVCTFRRVRYLPALIDALRGQETGGRFSVSVVVVDNDGQESARLVVEAAAAAWEGGIRYLVEPEQNIALARNKAVLNARGTHLAFIDDDEMPPSDWLLTLHGALLQYGADGVLGPVNPRFEETPPQWIVKARLFDRPTCETGAILGWRDCRTGNALLLSAVIERLGTPFREQFGSGGEDRDFFRRAIAQGCVFRWCNAAVVWEAVPPERCRRSFQLRRALLRGKASLASPGCGAADILKSLMAVVAYTTCLPFLVFLGQHVVMKYLIRDMDHLGKVLAFCGVHPVKERYVTE